MKIQKNKVILGAVALTVASLFSLCSKGVCGGTAYADDGKAAIKLHRLTPNKNFVRAQFGKDDDPRKIICDCGVYSDGKRVQFDPRVIESFFVNYGSGNDLPKGITAMMSYYKGHARVMADLGVNETSELGKVYYVEDRAPDGEEFVGACAVNVETEIEGCMSTSVVMPSGKQESLLKAARSLCNKVVELKSVQSAINRFGSRGEADERVRAYEEKAKREQNVFRKVLGQFVLTN